MAERTVTISSAGKTFSVTGWKVGWLHARRRAGRRRSRRSSSSSPTSTPGPSSRRSPGRWPCRTRRTPGRRRRAAGRAGPAGATGCRRGRLQRDAVPAGHVLRGRRRGAARATDGLRPVPRPAGAGRGGRRCRCRCSTTTSRRPGRWCGSRSASGRRCCTRRSSGWPACGAERTDSSTAGVPVPPSTGCADPRLPSPRPATMTAWHRPPPRLALIATGAARLGPLARRPDRGRPAPAPHRRDIRGRATRGGRCRRSPAERHTRRRPAGRSPASCPPTGARAGGWPAAGAAPAERRTPAPVRSGPCTRRPPWCGPSSPGPSRGRPGTAGWIWRPAGPGRARRRPTAW